METILRVHVDALHDSATMVPEIFINTLITGSDANKERYASEKCLEGDLQIIKLLNTLNPT